MIKLYPVKEKGRIQMQRKIPLPKEYVKELQKNPYILKATEWSVSFTPEFKRIAYREYYNGKSMRQIFTESGFDVKKIGEKRVQNFRNSLIKKAEQGENFEDSRKNNSRKEPQNTEEKMAKRIRELEHRNAYLQQENDFLKKIQALEKERGSKAGKQK